MEISSVWKAGIGADWRRGCENGTRREEEISLMATESIRRESHMGL